ncbi:MAG: hypothetical protein PHY78_04780 [Desulfobacterales bacterium]|nr:hypothetical protein [Desulfobacterales bacterium]
MSYLDELETKNTFFKPSATAIPAISAINEQKQRVTVANELLLPAILDKQATASAENSKKIAARSNGIADSQISQGIGFIANSDNNSGNSGNSGSKDNKNNQGDTYRPRCLGTSCQFCRYEQKDIIFLWCDKVGGPVIDLPRCPLGFWEKDEKGFPIPDRSRA